MLKFDKVPVMDREYFEQCLRVATTFAAWVQVNPALQRLVPISKQDAIEIAEDGFNFGYIWGQMSREGCLEISLTSQWLDRLSDEKENAEAIQVLDDLKNDQRLQDDQDWRPGAVLPGS